MARDDARVAFEALRLVTRIPAVPGQINLRAGSKPAQTPCGCYGSGRTHGGTRYCGCEMGRSLYAVEHRAGKRIHDRAGEISALLEEMGL